MKIAFTLIVLCIMLGPASAEFDFEGSLADGQLTRYVPPISNPLFNETPYLTTELRPILLHNKIPDDFVTTGGDIRIVAAEIRVALSDRWGFIASKDGYADIDFDAVLPDETGSANVSLGFKYAVYVNPAANRILTVGIEYEPATGTLETGGVDLQGAGDGFIDTFITGATTHGKWGLQGNLGYNLALDSDFDSSLLHLSGHVDYMLTGQFFPTAEFNVFSTSRDGDRLPFDFEGLDLVNFGSQNAGTVTTLAVGARYILNDNVMFGVAYEAPVSSREDIIDRRFYLDMIISL